MFSYQYDGDGNRVKQTAPNGDFTIYIAGLYEASYASTGALLNTKLYYAFAGKVVAMRDNSVLYYLHTDHLGSTRVVTDGTGQAVSLNSYYPFGASKYSSGARPTDMDFTGQRLDATGLNFYNARYYDSAIGRFISADTVVPGAGNSRAFNRFAYSYNNPLKYMGPTGHTPCGPGNEDDGPQCYTNPPPQAETTPTPTLPTPTTPTPPPPIPTPCFFCTYPAPPTPGPVYKPDQTVQMPQEDDPNSIDWWRGWREFFGKIDPLMPGATTGTAISYGGAVMQLAQDLQLDNPANPYSKPLSIVAVTGPIFASAYDFAYDNKNHTGEYCCVSVRPIQIVTVVIVVIVLALPK